LKLSRGRVAARAIGDCSIHPQGWVPIETGQERLLANRGGNRSIHPQGWVPIETECGLTPARSSSAISSIHPQGWVPIETPLQVQRV